MCFTFIYGTSKIKTSFHYGLLTYIESEIPMLLLFVSTLDKEGRAFSALSGEWDFIYCLSSATITIC